MNENNRVTTAAPTIRGNSKLLAMVGAVVFVGISLYASRASLPGEGFAASSPGDDSLTPTARAVKAADAFLESLESAQRDKATYGFEDAKKSKWSNFPVSVAPRNGVRMGDLTGAQRALAMQALASVLSKNGYQKMLDIMDGDQQLAKTDGKGGKGGKGKGGKGKGGNVGGGGPGGMFGSDLYYLAFFGKPSLTKPWMLQFGGHHLGLNVTVVGKNFVLAPTHTGAQPTIFKRDGKDVRPLGEENDAGFKLVNALDANQRSQAVVAERPQGDLLLGPGRDGRKVKPEGIKGSALTPNQQALLLDVIAAWVNIEQGEEAAGRMATIKSQIGDTYFVWKGPTTKGSAAYFRVQGPSVVIEYAPQGDVNHIHTVIRSPDDDYGAALRKQ
jgi:hypothetical protein